MKKTVLTLLASTLLLAPIATAQMMGGSGDHHGSTPSTPAIPSGGMQGGSGMMGGSMMGDMGGSMGHTLIVGPDGVAYTVKTPASTDSASNGIEVVAIRPAGSIAWSTKVGGQMATMELAGNLLLVGGGNGDMDMGTADKSDDRGTLTAVFTETGAVQWQLELGGHPAEVEPFPGGVYVLLMAHEQATGGSGMHGGTTGSTLMKRSIVAVDLTGKVLWTVALN